MVDMTREDRERDAQEPDHAGVGRFSTDLAQVMDINRLGALVAKTVSRDFRTGNPPPRVAEVEGGMINSIGLPTKGIEYFLEPPGAGLQALHAAAGRLDLTRRRSRTSKRWRATSARPDIDVIEVNISCPTREPGGGNFALHDEHTFDVDEPDPRGHRQADLGEALAQCRRRRGRRQGGGGGRRRRAGGLEHASSASRSTPTPSGRRSATSSAGCPAPASSRSSCAWSTSARKAVKIPIIGCGGIVKVEDVVEYMLAGASAVMIGYLIFRNPSGMIAIIEGLEQWCAQARLCPRRRSHRRDDRRGAAGNLRRRRGPDRVSRGGPPCPLRGLK